MTELARRRRFPTVADVAEAPAAATELHPGHVLVRQPRHARPQTIPFERLTDLVRLTVQAVPVETRLRDARRADTGFGHVCGGCGAVAIVSVTGPHAAALGAAARNRCCGFVGLTSSQGSLPGAVDTEPCPARVAVGIDTRHQDPLGTEARRRSNLPGGRGLQLATGISALAVRPRPELGMSSTLHTGAAHEAKEGILPRLLTVYDAFLLGTHPAAEYRIKYFVTTQTRSACTANARGHPLSAQCSRESRGRIGVSELSYRSRIRILRGIRGRCEA